MLQCPAAGPELSQQWVSHAFRQVVEKRAWSWRVKRGQFSMPAVYSDGTVTVTLNSPVVTGSGTTFTAAMVGLQFRVSDNSPIYTIQSFDSTTQITLDQNWGVATASGSSFEIYQVYVTPPIDFESFIAVWDPANNWRLWLHRQQVELNIWDAQRTNDGDAYYVVSADYSRSFSGAVDAVLQVRGTGPDPAKTADSSYTGPNDAVFTIEVTTGGAVETAIFKWKKDSGSYTTTITTLSTPQTLSNGISIFWPADTYISGDVFVIRVSAQSAPGIPRYELWPHKKSVYIYPFLYTAKVDDLEDNGMVIPRNIRGDVLLEHALARAASWPGTATNKNPYYDLTLSARHKSSAELMVRELERTDDNTYMSDLSYIEEMNFAPVPYGDSAWLQKHAI